MLANNKSMHFIWYVLWILTIIGCDAQSTPPEQPEKQSNGSELLLADCLIPEQVDHQRLGLPYLAQRGSIKTSAVDCGVLGEPDAQIYAGEIYEKGYGLAGDFGWGAYMYSKVSRNNDKNINKYKKKLQVDGAKANQQLKVREQLKADLKRYNNELAVKLKWVEQRSAYLSRELLKLHQKEGQLKAELVNLQAQLTHSKLSISQITDSLISEQHKIDKENELSTDQNKILADKNKQLDLLKSKLLKQNKKLEKYRSKIAQIEVEKEQGIINKKEFDKAQSKGISISYEHIKQLEILLALHEQIIENQGSQIQAVAKDKPVSEQKIKPLQTEEKQKLAYAKPLIEILEPPFTMTRSNDIPIIKLRSTMTHREITGRVNAPAGLLSFNVNGLNEEISHSGIFKSLIELKDKETLVKVAAIDKDGKKAELVFKILSAGDEKISAKKDVSENDRMSTKVNSDVNFGNYYGLIIGNQKYKHFPNLDTSVNDAKTIDKILREKYSFKTTLLLNANRYDILSALNTLRAKLTEVDNLLIYYAGFGDSDPATLRRYWLPVDAEPNNTANWISTLAITDTLNSMTAKQVLIVADSCYSRAMSPLSPARIDDAGLTVDLRLKWLRLMSKTRSRTVLTSGGLKPVMDSDMGGHSIFANAFIEAISHNNGILEGQILYRKVYDKLMKVTKGLNIKQEPQYVPIRYSGHEAGDFFLVAQGEN